MDENFHKFTSVFAEINHSMHRLKTECMAEFGLKSSHLLCLYYLYNESPLCTTELIKLCCEDKGSISRTVKELKEKGYIVSRNTLTNIYRVPIVLTQKGQETGEKLTEKIDSVMSKTSLGITNEEMTVMYKALKTIAENLNKIHKPDTF